MIGNEYNKRNMKDYGLVSIVTPSFNSSKFINKAIESVLSQTYQNWEMLITDDCSSDDSCMIIERYVEKDDRIKLFRLNENSGAGVARNNSISKAKGQFIAFLDSDDVWMPEKLEKQIAFMKNRNCALSCTSYMTINEYDEVIGMVLAPNLHTFFENKCDDKVGFSTAIYDCERLGKRFMPTIRKRQDWALVMSIMKDCKVAYGMKQPLGYYRKGQDSLSKNKISLVKYNIAAYQKVLGWSYIKAFIFLWLVYIPCNVWKKIVMNYINRY